MVGETIHTQNDTTTQMQNNLKENYENQQTTKEKAKILKEHQKNQQHM